MLQRSRVLAGLLSVVLLWPAGASAQTPDLQIRLRDAADQPLVGVTLIIRDQTGTRDLAQVLTDADGVAIVSGLTTDAVRVAVQGQLPTGTPLRQRGDDAPGMLVFLVGGTLTLDLVSDDQGVVQPSPQTVSALEPGIPLETALPTAPFPPPVPTLVAMPLGETPAQGSSAPADSMRAEDAPPVAPGTTWGLVLLSGLVALGAGMLVLIQRGRP